MPRRLALSSLAVLLAGCAARPLDVPEADAVRGSVRAIGLGYSHSCAVSDGGAVACWGWDADGELGDGTIAASQPRPVGVHGIADAVGVTGGESHSCARSADGSLRCWGSNQLGQLGIGSSGTPVVEPTFVAGGIIDVAAGFSYTCAVHDDGTAACWGLGDHGQLGDGASQNRSAPVDVAGLSDATQIAVSEYVSCALRRAGGVVCWGIGALGDGTTNGSPVPVEVQGLSGPAAAIAVGAQHACALVGGTVACWGYGGYGELGNPLPPDDVSERVATPVMSLPPAIAISAGPDHTCAVVEGGGVFCWGGDSAGRPGSRTPVRVAGITDAVRVSSGSQHDCVLTGAGRVRCWGANNVGQLGDGTMIDRDVPVTVSWP